MIRLRERVQSMVPDVDSFMDAEVSDADKTYLKYHLYLIIDRLDDFLD